MSIRVAINGYGRIGRCIARAIFEENRQQDFRIMAINTRADASAAAHMTRYDSTHGRFPKPVEVAGDYLHIDDQAIRLIAERDPARLDWKALGVDLVFECTGHFTKRSDAMQHIHAGAQKVLISAPGQDVDATIVYGVNHEQLRAEDRIVSNASCTTNCLAPVAKILHESVGIVSGLMNTIHAYTKDQLLLDGSHQDLRRARAAAHSIIPTKTGAAQAVGLVLPALQGKLDGFALRVPTMNVSVVDFTFVPERPVTVAEINDLVARHKSPILLVNHEPLVSCDFNHTPASVVFDATQTRVQNGLVKVVLWYDNEWGFANRMLDTAHCMMTR